MKKIDYYKKIISDISEKLLSDATENYEKELEFKEPDSFEFSASDYEIFSEKTIIEYYQNRINELERKAESLENSLRTFKNLYQKEKMGVDGKVMLRSSDFTKLKNIKEYVDELFERKEILENDLHKKTT